ncbi:hypothetical protein GCM10012275_42090 [Longimycelium tulufanense]|uniref:Transcriptional regulator n=1 Tax=Longimycelium tulufanense TaxID=907463 RepID=A0A8J3CIK8_9PSEU|nr:hypothetical protein [Longimycelium tulufanense]GGM67156.1 hypothetical protein GCM10012275_42090 [Longimycelium tulufanense]
MPEPNELLRAARLRIESPTTPGEPLSRQELAELVNAQVFRATEKISALDANHVGKWERGVIRWPAARYRAALRVVLDVATDRELGFFRSSRATVDEVDRKTFLKTAVGAGVGVFVAPKVPALVSAPESLAATIAGPTTHYRRLESFIPSDQLTPAVDAHLRLASGLVRERLRTATGFGVLSEVAGLAAWLAVDRGDTATARRHYTEAVRFAETSGHPLLVSYMTASLGHFAVESGDPRQGLLLIDRASARLDRDAPNTTRAWLASLHAVAHAAVRDRTSALAELRRAEKLVSKRQGEPRWPWVFAFDAPKAARYQSAALGLLGDLRAAQAAFEVAAPSLQMPKPRALAVVDHALVLARSGQIGQACSLAAEALAVGRRFGSERITARVRAFRASLPAATVEARELDNALAALYEREAL